MTHDTCTRLVSCSCQKSPAKKAIQVHTGQISSKTTLTNLSIFRCVYEKSVHGRPWLAVRGGGQANFPNSAIYRVYLSSSLERRRKRTLGTRLLGLLLPRVLNILKLVYIQESEQLRFLSCQPNERIIGPVLIISNCTFSSVA